MNCKPKVIKNCKVCDSLMYLMPSRANKTTVCSKEYKLADMKSRKPFKGKKHSLEARNKISEARKGKEVWSRDNFKCKIDNSECCGRIEAHHILRYEDHPELRYNINNGITLCHAHHPRKRAEEKRLEAEFQALVSVSKEIF